MQQTFEHQRKKQYNKEMRNNICAPEQKVKRKRARLQSTSLIKEKKSETLEFLTPG